MSISTFSITMWWKQEAQVLCPLHLQSSATPHQSRQQHIMMFWGHDTPRNVKLTFVQKPKLGMYQCLVYE